MNRRIQRWGCTVFVCVAACQNGEAPSASGAEPAAMMDPKQSTAAVANSGNSPASNTPAMPASNTPAMPAVARPAMSGSTNAPPAAGGGAPSATPGTAGAPAAANSAMPGLGSAGSSAASKPAQTPSAAGSCELPNKYTRATRSTIELSWPETIAWTAGTGKLVAWAKVTYTKGSDGALEMESHPCGSVLPEIIMTELLGGLKSASQVPFTAFDNPNMPTTRRMIMQRADRSLSFRTNTPLGTMLADPDAEWPSPAMLVPFDHDGDGSPGVTTLPVQGPDYARPPTSIAQREFLDRVYIASRFRAQVTLMPACSGTVVGAIEPLDIDSTVVGCHVDGRDDCDATEVEFIRDGRPVYTVGKSGTWTEVEVPENASCADVRSALPTP